MNPHILTRLHTHAYARTHTQAEDIAREVAKGRANE
jgi:hypothetical protein